MLGHSVQFFNFLKSLENLQKVFDTESELPCRLKVNVDIRLYGSNEFSNLYGYNSIKQLNSLADNLDSDSIIREVNKLFQHNHDRYNCAVSVPQEVWEHLMFIAVDTPSDNKYSL